MRRPGWSTRTCGSWPRSRWAIAAMACPLAELISEGNIGLMQGVKKFEPERGFRLATYAMWWIRASIQEFILRCWSLVKMGTTAAQKKLFFNLRRMKNRIEAFEDGDLKPEDVTKIATDLGVSEEDVDLDEPAHGDGRRHLAERAAARRLRRAAGRISWSTASRSRTSASPTPRRPGSATICWSRRWSALNDRERHILTERRLTDEPKTLEELSQVYDVSRERIRQIEVRAFEKLQKALMNLAGERRLLTAA